MGKSRRNRSGAARRDPISKPIKPPSDPELAALRESKIIPVINDLKSSDPKSRSAAASAISNIIQDTKCRKLLLREQVVQTVLAQTVTDASIESRAAGWGILQVLAQEEEADFCIHLFRSDVLTAIEFACKQIIEKLLAKDPEFSRTNKTEREIIQSIAASLISLLTALGEAGDDILDVVSANATFTRFLTVIISFPNDTHSAPHSIPELRTDALACLMILCEDNEKLAESIAAVLDQDFYRAIMLLKDEPNGDGVLACALLHNIFASLQLSKRNRQLLDINDAILIPTLTKAIASFSPDQPPANGAGWSDPSMYQQLALETLALIGSSLTLTVGGAPVTTRNGGLQQNKAAVEEEEDEDMGDANGAEVEEEDAEDGDGDIEEDEDDEMDQEELEADMDLVTGVDQDDDDDDNDQLPILKNLTLLALPELIRIASSQPTDESSMTTQGYALSALNNIAWSLSLFDFTDDSNLGIQKLWSPVAHSIWETVISPILASDTADLQLATQITSLAWAIARTLHSRTPLQPGEHRKFISLYQATRSSSASTSATETSEEVIRDPFQALGVKCIGALGQLAIACCSEDLNREIGTFLITVVAALPQTPPADAVESFNQIFDIYGNEDYDYDRVVFWKDNFLTHLSDIVPKVRSMAKSVDKKTQAELRLRADEVVMNLTRFLAYKNKHKPTIEL